MNITTETRLFLVHQRLLLWIVFSEDVFISHVTHSRTARLMFVLCNFSLSSYSLCELNEVLQLVCNLAGELTDLLLESNDQRVDTLNIRL